MKRVFIAGVLAMLGAAVQPARLSAQQNSPPVENPAPAKDRHGEALRIFQEGQAALNRGELDHAEAAFLKVLKLDRTSAAAHANLGVVDVKRTTRRRFRHSNQRCGTSLIYSRRDIFSGYVTPSSNDRRMPCAHWNRCGRKCRTNSFICTYWGTRPFIRGMVRSMRKRHSG